MSANKEFNSISKRGARSANLENILLQCFEKVMENPFDVEKNPSGNINMGTSENKLVTEIMSERISKIQLGNMPNCYMQYAAMQGVSEFRDSLASFLTRYMKPANTISKDNLYVFNGCGSVVEMMAFAICDEGDCILIPSPYYGAFKTDLACRMGCVIHSIELSSAVKADFGETSPFELSVGRMQEAYDQAKSQGLNVRGIILSNPNNPLGNIYSKQQLTEYLQFASKHQLHVILDEIYFLSIYDSNATMTTGLSLSGIIEPELLHIVWGFSKDFAVSGFRCGLVHTVNEDIKRVLLANSYFQSVPTPMQFILQSIIDDRSWLDNVYFPTNIERLRRARKHVTDELKEIGVDIFPAVAGLYVWADFRSHVKPLSREGELKLLNMFLDNGVYICPGVAFHSTEFGWFRIIVSVNDEQLFPGVTRIKEVLNRVNEVEAAEANIEHLDDLVSGLQKQIRESDWLEKNTAENWMEENPQLAAKFMEQKRNSELKN